MWSANHGPVFSQEPELFTQTLLAWKADMLRKHSSTPIVVAVARDPRVFNGYGQQEACDVLFWAMIHPRMPTFLVCNDEALWTRFFHHVTTYQVRHLALLQPPPMIPVSHSPLPFHSTRAHPVPPDNTTIRTRPEKGHKWPHVSLGKKPFYFNANGHQTFLLNVAVYRRKTVRIPLDLFRQYESSGLLNPLAVMQDDGTANGRLQSFLFGFRMS